MLAQLLTIKLRLGLDPNDPSHDTILANALAAVGARFDLECNRTLARTVSAAFEFDSDQTEISVPCYPIESITRFETKLSEASGWVLRPAVDHLIRRSCIISLASALNPPSAVRSLARVIYTGGYLMPGDPDPDSQPSTLNSQPLRLPADLETAAVEQVAFWYQSRDQLGLKTYWPHGSDYIQFATFDLLPSVTSVLSRHTRLLL